MEKDEYLKVNQELWDKKTGVHVDSDFYDMESFLAGETTLKPIELDLLGDVKGKKILHLQCHFGQDSLSLARMGAEVTGVDLSGQAIQKARELADQLDLPARFIQSNVLELDQNLNGEFDIVFTSYGVIGWLPELEGWARIIDHFLKPGGAFIMVEFHQMLWMFDENFQSIKYSYFNQGAIIEEIEGSYADPQAPIKANSYQWDHSLSEVFSALLGNGLQITHFREYDYSPYNCFNQAVEVPGGYQVKGLEGRLPMVFSVVARK